jgi:hypothetical protein
MNWLNVAALWAALCVLAGWAWLSIQLDGRRQDRAEAREAAKLRHPAKGTRPLDDLDEWLAIVEALADEDMGASR